MTRGPASEGFNVADVCPEGQRVSLTDTSSSACRRDNGALCALCVCVWLDLATAAAAVAVEEESAAPALL